MLGPGCSVAHEDVGCSGVQGAVVALVTVHSGGAAVFTPRPDDQRITCHRYPGAERVTGIGVGGFEIGLLGPVGSVAHEDVGCSGVQGAVVALVTVHSGGAA